MINHDYTSTYMYLCVKAHTHTQPHIFTPPSRGVSVSMCALAAPAVRGSCSSKAPEAAAAHGEPWIKGEATDGSGEIY